jgi:hypothetical protein
MGKPVRVEVKGLVVFLCCEGCRAELEAEPEKFLAKLGMTGAGVGGASAPEGAAAKP